MGVNTNTKNQSKLSSINLYGEVLFDCFTDANGKENQVLGGAPFNICWHLQALGDAPNFISRIGNDDLGQKILKQAKNWGIETQNIQLDQQHATGKVQVEIIDDEPHYDIRENSAYDFIQADSVILSPQNKKGILYHGSLALRSKSAQQQFNALLRQGDWDLFLDVNLRSPWWDKQKLQRWIKQARWVKLNIDELSELGFKTTDLKQAMTDFQKKYQNEQVIVTLGADGVAVMNKDKFYTEKPEKIKNFIDTVGAGDAFTAVYMHGLMHEWPIQEALAKAQRFASKIIAIQGATPENKDFYNAFF